MLVCATAFTASVGAVLTSLAGCWTLGGPMAALLASAAVVTYLSTHWQTCHRQVAPPADRKGPRGPSYWLVLPAANAAALAMHRAFVQADRYTHAALVYFLYTACILFVCLSL